MIMVGEIILGLDVSTSCIGVSICGVGVDGNVTPLEVTHLRLKVPSKVKGMEAAFAKSELFRQWITKYKEYNISRVVIEEPLTNSAINVETVALLLKFNGMVSQTVYNELGIVPEYISSYDARKYGYPNLMSVRKYKKNGEVYPEAKIRKAIKNGEVVLFGAYPFDCAKKLIIWNYVSELFPQIQWVYNKNNELAKENFDASDSLICVLGYVNKMRYGDVEPKVRYLGEEDGESGTVLRYEVDFCGKKMNKSIDL